MNENRDTLHQVLTSHFSIDELRSLCFFLNFEYDNLSGEGKTGKARELILYLERRERINELVAEVKKQRPNIAKEIELEDEFKVLAPKENLERQKIKAQNPVDNSRNLTKPSDVSKTTNIDDIITQTAKLRDLYNSAYLFPEKCSETIAMLKEVQAFILDYFQNNQVVLTIVIQQLTSLLDNIQIFQHHCQDSNDYSLELRTNIVDGLQELLHDLGTH